MKTVITLVVLITALFVTLEAAPVLPSGFEAAEEQQSDEMAKTFLNILNKILGIAGNRIGRDGSIQADDELGQTFLNFVSNFLSSVSKIANPNDEVAQTLLNGVNSILPLLETRLDEGGEIQSDDDRELMQTVANLLTTLFTDATKRIESGELPVHDQSAGENELGRKVFNAGRDLISAIIRKSDPNDEMKQTALNGWKTIISSIVRQLDREDEGDIQSSSNVNSERKQTFLNLLTSVHSGIKKKMDIAKIESLDPDMLRTFFNIFKTMNSAARRAIEPDNKIGQTFYNVIDKVLPLIAKQISDGGKIQSSDEMVQKFTSNVLSTMTKKIESSDIQSADEVNLFGMDLSERATTQLWGAILGSLATGLLNKSLDG